MPFSQTLPGIRDGKRCLMCYYWGVNADLPFLKVTDTCGKGIRERPENYNVLAIGQTRKLNIKPSFQKNAALIALKLQIYFWGHF